MAETQNNTQDALLEAILNELDMTYADDTLKKKIADIQRRGDGYLQSKYGGVIDYSQDMQARELLFSYCRYGRSNAIEQFENDFLSEITELGIRGGIAAMKEGAESGE